MNSVAELVSALGGAATTAAGAWKVAQSGSTATREGQKMSAELDWRKQLQGELEALQKRTDEKIAALEARVEQAEAAVADRTRTLVVMGNFLDEVALIQLYGRDDDQHPDPPDGPPAQFYDRGLWVRIADIHNARIENRSRRHNDEGNTHE